MSRAKTVSIVVAASAVVLAACQAVVSLSSEPIKTSSDAGASDHADITPRPMPESCQGLGDDRDRGRPVFCNRFEVEQPKFGFEEQSTLGNFELTLDGHASNSARSLKFFIPSQPDTKPFVFGSYKVRDTPADKLSLSFDLSVGAKGPFDAATTSSPIALAAFRFDEKVDGRIVAFGVYQGAGVVAFVENLADIDFTDAIDRGRRIGSAWEAGYAFREIELRVRRHKMCGDDLTTFVDGGAPPDALYIGAFTSGQPLGCLQLPSVQLGRETTVLVGGYRSKKAESIEWRVDNVVVRALD